MNLVRRIVNFYIDASIHVAFAVFSLVHVTSFILNITYNHHLAYFLFFGSIACYNFIKYGVEAEKYILVATNYHKSIQFFSIVCLLIAGYHAHFFNRNTYIVIAILVALTGLYALPLFPKAKNLRSWGGLKVFVVALVWSGATVLLPVLVFDYSLSWDVWIETIQRFLLVLVLLVPFEIRDLAYDSPDLKTLPQRFGVRKTKVLGAIATVIFFVLTFLKDDISISELVSKSILLLILTALMFITKRNQSRYFSSFWVEAIPMVWCGILLLFEYQS